MEIREPRSKAGSIAGYSPVKSLQVLAEDISNISAANFERNNKLLHDLQGARTLKIWFRSRRNSWLPCSRHLTNTCS